MRNVLLCIPPHYEYNFPPLATPALCAFLKKGSIPVSQADLNLGYRDFLRDRISCSTGSREDAARLLPEMLRVFFSTALRDRYYSPLLPGAKDAIFPYIPYGDNSNSSFYFTERLLSSGMLFRYLADEEENTFLQFYLGAAYSRGSRRRAAACWGSR